MCGIVGYIGKNAILNNFENLKKLEYRGYDSAGIAYIKNKKIKCIKSKGFIKNAETKALKLGDESMVSIAHTRWATTGKVSTKNAHPHLSNSKRFAVVHNGIIENYTFLKTIISKDYIFKSETDTEIICALLDHFSKQENSTINIIKLVIKNLKGSFSIAILDETNPNNIYVVKKDMPIFVCTNDEFSAIASSVSGLPEKTNSYIMLENHDIAILSKNSINIYNNDKLVKRPIFFTTESNNSVNKSHTKHYMLKEILEIPEKLEKTYLNFEHDTNQYKQMINNLFIGKSRIHLVACGTAYHSCLIGAKLFSICGYDSTAHIASEFKYNPPILSKNSLYIFVSQSGETADTLGALKIVQDLGLDALSITNVPSSTMAHISNNHILTVADSEIAVASTKAYVCQCLVFYLIAKHLNDKLTKFNVTELQIDKIINNLRTFEKIGKYVSSFKKVFFIGRNFDYITSMEGALKLKEISYIMAESYPAGELKHGSLALIDGECLSILVSTDSNMIYKLQNTISEIKSRNGKVLVISPFDEYQSQCVDYFIKIPETNHTLLYPLLSVVPLQLISYFASISLKLNPDKPRNLAKSVTVE